MAKRNDRPFYPWVVSGLLFGIWALTLLLLLVITGEKGEKAGKPAFPFPVFAGTRLSAILEAVPYGVQVEEADWRPR